MPPSLLGVMTVWFCNVPSFSAPMESEKAESTEVEKEEVPKEKDTF